MIIIKTKNLSKRLQKDLPLIFIFLFFWGAVGLSPSLLSAQEISSVQETSRPQLLADKVGSLVYQFYFSSTDYSGSVVFNSANEKVEALVLDSPYRLVIDVFGAFNGKNKTISFEKNQVFKSLRIGAHKEKIRFVFDLADNVLDRKEDLNFTITNSTGSSSVEHSKVTFSIATTKTATIVANLSTQDKDPTKDKVEQTATPLATERLVLTNTPSSTSVASATATETVTPSLQITASTLPDFSPSPTATIQPSLAIYTPTLMPTITSTTPSTAIPTSTSIATTTATATSTKTSSPSPSRTTSPTKTALPTKTSTQTKTPTPSSSPTQTKTSLPSKTATATATAKPSLTSIPTRTALPITATPSPAPTSIPIIDASSATAPANQDHNLQEVKSLTFDYQQPDHLPVINLHMALRPNYKLIKRDDGTFILTFSECVVSNKLLKLPQFPPQDFLGFRFIQVISKKDSCEVLIGVDKGTRIAAFANATNVFIRSLGFASK